MELSGYQYWGLQHIGDYVYIQACPLPYMWPTEWTRSHLIDLPAVRIISADEKARSNDRQGRVNTEWTF